MLEVYRFNEFVAINPPNGPTIYLNAAEAEWFAERLSETAEDVRIKDFTKSTLGPAIRESCTGQRR